MSNAGEARSALARSALPGPRRRARGFASASDGTTTVEVALLGFPFLALLVGLAAVGYVTWANSTLDFATQKAARQVMTGALQAKNTTLSQFKSNVLCAYLPSPPFDCSQLVVNLVTVAESDEPTGWYNLVNAGQSGLVRPTSTSFCLGAGNAYQVLQVLYPYPIYSRLVATSAALAAGQSVAMSTAAFKNEPFQGAGAGSC